MTRFGVTTLPTLFKVRSLGSEPERYTGQIQPKGVCDFLKNFADTIR